MKDVNAFYDALNGDAIGTPPRAITPFKFYQSHPEFKPRIDEVYTERYGNEKARFRLSEHTSIAKELFDAESDEVKARIMKEAEEEHSANMNRYNELLTLDKFDTSDSQLVER
jgi:hypothetical protein